jgi:hypothetical protein
VELVHAEIPEGRLESFGSLHRLMHSTRDDDLASVRGEADA